ncbi:hypothetical protein ABIB62_000278 [Mucilaginibacter sp. UYP25]
MVNYKNNRTNNARFILFYNNSFNFLNKSKCLMRLFLQVDYRTSNLMQVFAGVISICLEGKEIYKAACLSDSICMPPLTPS